MLRKYKLVEKKLRIVRICMYVLKSFFFPHIFVSKEIFFMFIYFLEFLKEKKN